jgi:hypothetical protein
MKKFNILPKNFGFTFDYDSKLNPSIINSFAGAAFRFHSLIQVNKTLTFIDFENIQTFSIQN